MGNGITKFGVCFTGPPEARYRPDPFCVPADDGLGHSFCYVRPDPARSLLTGPAPQPSSKIHSEESSLGSSIFRSISGASVSANTSTPPSTAAADTTMFSAAFFESSTSFASVPLQPIPRSGPLSGPLGHDLGFTSGPIDRSGGFMSGPLERAGPIFSGPLDRSFSVHGGGGGGGRWRRRRSSGSLMRTLRRAISKTFGPTSVVAPVKGLGVQNYYNNDNDDENINKRSSYNGDDLLKSGSIIKISNEDTNDELTWQSQNLQWAQGKAGEDRVHVVVSEEFGWVFVGIYDGFNGPDATDFLLSNLYPSVQKHLKGLLWDDNSDHAFSSSTSIKSCCTSESSIGLVRNDTSRPTPVSSSRKGRGKKWEENQRRWKCEWDRERVELDRRLREGHVADGGEGTVDHGEVLEALSRALGKTEEAYLDIADKMLDENPELCLMGSCVLAMLMKGEDVYVMNVGDCRAVLGRNKEPDLRLGKVDHDLERINEESMFDFEVSDGVRCNLNAIQLSVDHSTNVEEEVQRIRDEHPDDAFAVSNDRVKGSLKVTRAFGAGFLKQKKWNDALLEMFRIDYVGDSPYINCQPFLYHHRLGPKDQFLILSSDGLYQYFTNEEAVSEVELFISLSPEGDPAQHLVEEVLFRAAKRAGLDFYELLEIPQGDRRRYHDDVSIIVISFEGRIWRSCV